MKLSNPTAKQVISCLCCKYCLPPSLRIDGKMCNLSTCKPVSV